MSRATPASEAPVRLRPGSFVVPGVAALVLSASVLIPLTSIRAAVVFPVALLLPGYAILLLAFGSNRRLDPIPALALSTLLSMAFYPLASLGLAAASIALSTRNIVGAVDALVAATLLVSFLRGRRLRGLPRPASWLPAEPPHRESERGMDAKRMVVLTAAAVVLAGLAVGLVLHVESKPASLPYTQFYLTGAQSHSSTPPTASGGAPLSLPVGVTNHTHRLQTYRIEPEVDGRSAWPARSVTLPPGGTWTGRVRGRMPADHGLHELIITLTREPQSTPVGSLTVWLRSGLPQ